MMHCYMYLPLYIDLLVMMHIIYSISHTTTFLSALHMFDFLPLPYSPLLLCLVDVTFDITGVYSAFF